MKRWWVLLLVAAGCQQGAAQPAERARPTAPAVPDYVKVEPVAEAAAGGAVSLPARVAFDEDHTQRLASPIDGRVRSVLVHPGDRVRAGQVLVELASPKVGELQLAVRRAAEDASLADKALARTRTLREGGAASDRELAQAETEARKAHAELTRAEAQLRALGIAASDPAISVELRAQIAGTVVARSVLVGQEVRGDGAEPLVTVSNLASVWVLGEIYEPDLAAVERGAAASVEVPAWPGQRFAGKVAHVGEVVDEKTRTIEVRCVVPNPDGRLKPGMFARVELAAARGARRALVVPARAVLTDGERAEVVIATGDPAAPWKLRPVVVGPESTDGTVRVLSGLTAGERIVTDGALFVKRELERK